MSPITLTCRTCGDTYLLPEDAQLRQCPSCGTVNARPQAEGEAFDKLQRATRLRLHGEYAEAETCYRHVLVEYDDDHEALWGKLLCQYGVEFVTDPKTGVRHATVHLPRKKPMQLQADFARACELAPEAVRAPYETEAAWVDEILAEIHGGQGFGEPYDVFICHKTTHLTGPGYTEDYNRGVQLSIRLTKEGYRVFFAPFADLAPGASYEAGIYHALSTSKVMLLISSDPAFLTSPWVRSEWSRYLEMLDDGADKHLIPLMYGSLSDARMPKEIRLRGLQSIRMDSDLDAKDKLLAALEKYTGKGATAPVAVPQPAPAQPVSVEPQPVATAVPQIAPVQPQPEPQAVDAPENACKPVASLYTPESDFVTAPTPSGCAITRYTGIDARVIIPPSIEGIPVTEIGKEAFRTNLMLEEVEIPGSVTQIGYGAFRECRNLRRVSLPDNLTALSGNAFQSCLNLQEIVLPTALTEVAAYAFNACTSLREVVLPEKVVIIGESAFDFCSNLQSVTLPAGLRSIGSMAFYRCAELSKINLPEGVQLGKDVFGQCRKLPNAITKKSSTGFAGFLDKILPL